MNLTSDDRTMLMVGLIEIINGYRRHPPKGMFPIYDRLREPGVQARIDAVMPGEGEPGDAYSPDTVAALLFKLVEAEEADIAHTRASFTQGENHEPHN